MDGANPAPSEDLIGCRCQMAKEDRFLQKQSANIACIPPSCWSKHDQWDTCRGWNWTGTGGKMVIGWRSSPCQRERHLEVPPAEHHGAFVLHRRAQLSLEMSNLQPIHHEVRLRERAERIHSQARFFRAQVCPSVGCGAPGFSTILGGVNWYLVLHVPGSIYTDRPVMCHLRPLVFPDDAVCLFVWRMTFFCCRSLLEGMLWLASTRFWSYRKSGYVP